MTVYSLLKNYLKFIWNLLCCFRRYRLSKYISWFHIRCAPWLSQFSNFKVYIFFFIKYFYIILGYFDRRDQPEYNIFRRVATNLKDDCQFHVGFEDASRQMHPPGQPVVVFRPDKDRSNDLDETYNGSLSNFDELHIWIAEKCVPLVREITFENAEELTEEGLPFLILFHSPDDKESIKRYNEIVQTDLLSEKREYPIDELVEDDFDVQVMSKRITYYSRT